MNDLHFCLISQGTTSSRRLLNHSRQSRLFHFKLLSIHFLMLFFLVSSPQNDLLVFIDKKTSFGSCSLVSVEEQQEKGDTNLHFILNRKC